MCSNSAWRTGQVLLTAACWRYMYIRTYVADYIILYMGAHGLWHRHVCHDYWTAGWVLPVSYFLRLLHAWFIQSMHFFHTTSCLIRSGWYCGEIDRMVFFRASVGSSGHFLYPITVHLLINSLPKKPMHASFAANYPILLLPRGSGYLEITCDGHN